MESRVKDRKVNGAVVARRTATHWKIYRSVNATVEELKNSPFDVNTF
jgi:hypothetical protein